MDSWLSPKQQQAVDIVSTARRGIAWWKVGEGKTRIAISTYLRLIEGVGENGYAVLQNKKLLVICSPQANRQWLDELALYPGLEGPGTNKLFEDKVEFISYGVLSTPKGEIIAHKTALRKDVGLIVVDELWMYKNVRSKRTLNIHTLTSRHPTIGLSGSMITSRNIEDIYGQAYAINISQKIATSLTNFRTQFCVAVEEYGLQYYAKKGAIETIQSRLAPHLSIYFPRDVRETRIQRINVVPSGIQQKTFRDLQEDYYTNLGDGKELEIKSAATLIIKLQQASDGVILDSDGASAFISSSKATRLLQLLEEYADGGQKVLVWFAFKASLNYFFEKLAGKATALSSAHEFDSVGWAKGKYTCTLATIGSGASLNDFKDCQHAIIYSLPHNWRALQQAMGRTNRTGSQHKVCFYRVLFTEESVDAGVFDATLLTGDVEKAAIKSSSQVLADYMQQFKKPT
jgi:hypothetical protein